MCRKRKGSLHSGVDERVRGAHSTAVFRPFFFFSGIPATPSHPFGTLGTAMIPEAGPYRYPGFGYDPCTGVSCLIPHFLFSCFIIPGPSVGASVSSARRSQRSAVVRISRHSWYAVTDNFSLGLAVRFFGVESAAATGSPLA